MAIKSYKPTTAGRRGMTVTDYSELSKVAPCKSLLEPLKKNSGRNSYGRITVRHRGGGVRRKYRVIDFKRNKLDMNATVLTIEYDPNRSACRRRPVHNTDAIPSGCALPSSRSAPLQNAGTGTV